MQVISDGVTQMVLFLQISEDYWSDFYLIFLNIHDIPSRLAAEYLYHTALKSTKQAPSERRKKCVKQTFIVIYCWHPSSHPVIFTATITVARIAASRSSIVIYSWSFFIPVDVFLSFFWMLFDLLIPGDVNLFLYVFDVVSTLLLLHMAWFGTVGGCILYVLRPRNKMA